MNKKRIMDSDDSRSEIVQVKNEVVSNDFIQMIETSALKHEQCEIDMSGKCGRFDRSFSTEEPSKDHSYEEQKEEIYDQRQINLIPKNLPTNECSTEQIKSEVNIDILYDDIKVEIDENFELACKICKKCSGSRRDKPQSSNEFDCSCQWQIEPTLLYSILDDNMTEDVKLSCFDSTTASGLQLPTREQTADVTENEVNKSSLAKPAVEEHKKNRFLNRNSKSPKQRSNLSNHGVTHTLKGVERGHIAKKKFHCRICPKSFTRKTNLNIHKLAHVKGKPFYCKICYKSFTHVGNFKRHLMIHTWKKPFHCKVCPKSFAIEFYLRAHEKNHLRGHTGEKSFHCHICSKAFIHKINLMGHMLMHAGKNPFHCKICSKSFTNGATLRRHRIIHTGEKPFHCKICSKSFARRWDLKFHERTHIKRKTFRCSICQKSFIDGKSLKRHHKRVHSVEKPKTFLCQICSKYFSTVHTLKNHEKTHTGEKPFQCEICLKSFVQKGTLKRHELLVHVGQKPFNCKICSKSFSVEYSLQKHQRVHSGEKPFQCQICSKHFAQRYALKSHENIHTGEKPFHCPTCSMSFAWRESLRRHVKTHTEEKPCIKKSARNRSKK